MSKATKKKVSKAKPAKAEPVSNLPVVYSPQVQAMHAAHPMIGVIERLAGQKDFDPGKLRELLILKREEDAIRARTAFNLAMSAAQEEMRPIAADADNPQTKSRYATYLKLDGVMRPIYTRHGFSLSFNCEDSPMADSLRIVCYAGHVGQHERRYQIDIPADGKGAKGGDVMTKTHAAGSAVSYGMRYLLKMIFNIAIGKDEDDDGNAASRRGKTHNQEKFPTRDGEVIPPAGNEAQRSYTRPDGDEQITPEQLKRLHTIGTKSGRKPEAIKAWLGVAYGIASSRDVTRKDYEAVCDALMKPGPLPLGKTTREPGEDG